MYARCTHCNTIFRVTEEQLKIAKGYVRCGVCEQPFNALQNIEEKKPSESQKNQIQENKAEHQPSNPQNTGTYNKPSEPPQFQSKNWFSGKLAYQGKKTETTEQGTTDKSSDIISDDDQEIFFKERSHVFTVIGGIDHIWQDASATPEDLIKHSEQHTQEETTQHEQPETEDLQQDPPKNKLEKEEIPDPASDDEFTILNNKQLAQQLISDLEHHNKDIVDIDIPPVTNVITEEELLTEQKQPKPPKLTKKQIRSIAFWSGSYVLALLIFCLQIIYAMRTDLAKHIEVRPLLEVMCSITKCKLPPRRMPERIFITNRSVKVHPYQPNALLVEASFINQSSFTQAYPVVELTFYGYNGDLIGKRQFLPKEYMDNKPQDMLLRPDEEASLYLELVSPGKDVASFEFNFL